MVDTDTCMMEVVDPNTTWVMPMGCEVKADLLVAYADHLLTQMVDTTTERFGTYKEKSLQVHSELNKSVIAKKVRKGVEAFAEQQGFTKEFIVEARERHAAQQIEKRKKQQAKKPVVSNEEETESKGEKKALRSSGKRSKDVRTSIVKTVKKLVTKLTSFEKIIMHVKEYVLLTVVVKLYESFGEIDARRQVVMKQDRECIEFILKNLQPEATREDIDETLEKVKSSFRSKKRLKRMLIGETQSVHMEIELILKKLLGLLPDEEEEQPKKFEIEDILKNVDISDFTPDEIVMGDQPVDDQSVNTQTDIVVITDDDTGTNDIDTTDSEEKKVEEDKRSEEPPVHTQIVLPPVNDSEKNKEEEKTEDKPKEKKEEEEKETNKSEPKVTPLSFTSKKKIDDDEDDDALSMQGPINMDMLSSTELMEIATAMQSREKMKRMKEQ
ncbi:uncharacterized protein LOC131858157 [Cryptomeria japonica]|uniref:uncharacterized protein LOC131858157 n=1 Tax=Cryptomeria japonica TaxID=3369 RepID=UPI0027DA6A42|nr:uncharacterized protein LOC131858157 [Cryptomeria japonica]